MKKVLISGGLAVFIALAGCQATNEEGARHPDNNIDRYQNTTTERWANDRNYTMERDADRYQNRDFRNVNNRFGDRTIMFSEYGTTVTKTATKSQRGSRENYGTSGRN